MCAYVRTYRSVCVQPEVSIGVRTSYYVRVCTYICTYVERSSEAIASFKSDYNTKTMQICSENDSVISAKRGAKLLAAAAAAAAAAAVHLFPTRVRVLGEDFGRKKERKKERRATQSVGLRSVFKLVDGRTDGRTDRRTNRQTKKNNNRARARVYVISLHARIFLLLHLILLLIACK